MYKNKENKKAINRKKLCIDNILLLYVYILFLLFLKQHINTQVKNLQPYQHLSFFDAWLVRSQKREHFLYQLLHVSFDLLQMEYHNHAVQVLVVSKYELTFAVGKKGKTRTTRQKIKKCQSCQCFKQIIYTNKSPITLLVTNFSTLPEYDQTPSIFFFQD